MTTTLAGRVTLRVVAVLVAVLVPGLGVQHPATAAGERCTSDKDVTVVVDYERLRGGVDFFCARGAGGMTGFEIMQRAGISAQTVNGQPFVCRIESYPKDQTCTSTPPPDAYWGLFWSDGSPQTWSYSSRGAASLRVPGGGSLGWRFQNGGDPDRPAAAPTAPTKARPKPSPEPAPSPTPKPSASPRPTPSAGAAGAPSSSPSSAPQGTPSSAATPATTRKASGPASASAKGKKAGKSKAAKAAEARTAEERRGREDRDGRDDEDVTTSADEEYEASEPMTQPVARTSATDDGGSATTVGALVLLVGLGASAAVVARRRRAS